MAGVKAHNIYKGLISITQYEIRGAGAGRGICTLAVDGLRSKLVGI